jgi:hypothetical protein
VRRMSAPIRVRYRDAQNCLEAVHCRRPTPSSPLGPMR